MKLISKKDMTYRFNYPYFGITLYGTKEIFVRNDIPKIVQTSVIAHEKNHLERGHQGAFWKDEPPAWLAGFKAQPLGFFLGIFMSLNPERLTLYCKRLRENF